MTNNKKLAYACFMTLEQTDLQRTEIFKVLSDINRLRIIRVLHHAQREMTCGEIGEKLNISKSTVSYHFKMLRQVGLTNTRRASQSKYLSLNDHTFNNFLPGFLDSL
ncbi:transcription regulator [Leuconostoc sp. C2]|nr:transcription regulator [Leuconostoc sp. C2]